VKGAENLRSGGGNVRGGEEVGNDDDTPGSGGQNLREVGALDAANAKRGDVRTDIALHFGDVGQADTGTAELGGSGEKRTKADVVKSLGQGSAGLVGRMGGASEDYSDCWNLAIGLEDGAGVGQGAIVLADVDAIGR
jgi:hypothetical protein